MREERKYAWLLEPFVLHEGFFVQTLTHPAVVVAAVLRATVLLIATNMPQHGWPRISNLDPYTLNRNRVIVMLGFASPHDSAVPRVPNTRPA